MIALFSLVAVNNSGHGRDRGWTPVNTTRSLRSLRSDMSIKLYWIQFQPKNVSKSQLFNNKNAAVNFHQWWHDLSHDFWWLGLDSSHVEKDGNSTRVMFFTECHDSSHNHWLETQVRVKFTKSLSLWWTSPFRLHGKKWVFFASVRIKISTNFLFWLSSRVMLHCEDQVFSGITEVDLRLTEGQTEHNILTHYRGLM